MILERGSLWRKWDLHIHTPASIHHWKGTKRYIDITNPQEKDSLTRQVIDAIESADIDLVAIQDYWTFDGFLHIRDYLQRNPAISLKTKILPGIELRVEAPMKKRLNLHVILSDSLSDLK